MTRCAAVLGLTLAACGADEGPTLSGLSYLGQAARSPLTLQLGVGFEHPAGELGLGELHLAIDGQESSQLSCAELFRAQSPELALDARRGTLRLEVALTPPIVSGQELEIGLVAVDRLGLASNEPTITLRAGAVGAGAP